MQSTLKTKPYTEYNESSVQQGVSRQKQTIQKAERIYKQKLADKEQFNQDTKAAAHHSNNADIANGENVLHLKGVSMPASLNGSPKNAKVKKTTHQAKMFNDEECIGHEERDKKVVNIKIN